MKRYLLIICIAFLSFSTFAQEIYTIDGENLSLYTAVEGDVTLLWNTIDNQYRYFVVKDGETYELTNTRFGEKNRFEHCFKSR